MTDSLQDDKNYCNNQKHDEDYRCGRDPHLAAIQLQHAYFYNRIMLDAQRKRTIHLAISVGHMALIEARVDRMCARYLERSDQLGIVVELLVAQVERSAVLQPDDARLWPTASLAVQLDVLVRLDIDVVCCHVNGGVVFVCVRHRVEKVAIVFLVVVFAHLHSLVHVFVDEKGLDWR